MRGHKDGPAKATHGSAFPLAESCISAAWAACWAAGVLSEFLRKIPEDSLHKDFRIYDVY